MADSPWVLDVSEATFERDVLERSRQVPVVVDFWAPWCGPCRQLGPMLEGLAAEKGGAFVLAKINTDENPGVAEQFGVSGIPAVFAVKDGQLVNQFVGLLPPDQLKAFVDGLLPTEADHARGDALELEGRDPPAALAAYRRLLAADPADHAARVGAARVLLATPGNEAEATELLAPVEVGEHQPEAERLRTVVRIRQASHTDAELAAARSAAAAEDAPARLRLGQVLAARGEYLPALDALLSAAELDKKLGTGPVRELMVDIFNVIGARSDTADEYRSRLRSLLY